MLAQDYRSSDELHDRLFGSRGGLVCDDWRPRAEPVPDNTGVSQGSQPYSNLIATGVRLDTSLDLISLLWPMP